VRRRSVTPPRRTLRRTGALRPRLRPAAVPTPPTPGLLEVVLATRNPGKIREFLELMHDLPIQVYSLEAFPQIGPLAEDGQTYTENAITKAATVARLTGRVAVADDSGLEVDALEGGPGPQSRRFLGDQASDAARNTRILKLLHGVPAERRTARYRAVVAVALPGGEVRTFEGSCEGKIATSARGSGGFGYDPIFLVPAYGKTMAQLPLAVKNRLSHRARALAAARPYLTRLAAGTRSAAAD